MHENEPFDALEISRYSRHFLLKEVGIEGQKKLKESKVLVVGAGGLGCPVLQYLSAAGVGIIGIVDGDRVSQSNLHRQILFTPEDIGRLKSEVAIEVLSIQNPHVHFHGYPYTLNATNAREIIKEYDLVIDGSDNFPTRYLINDACVLEGKIFVFGAVTGFEGQVSVCNMQGDQGQVTDYRDICPKPPPPGLVPDCGEAGVLGVLPGIIGTIQAAEAIKVLLGLDSTLNGSVLLVDLLEPSFRKVKVQKNPDNPYSGKTKRLNELMDYHTFCGTNSFSVPEITSSELKELLDSEQQIQLIDVREPYEFVYSNLGGLNIPVTDLENQVMGLDRSLKTVMVCRSGKRSQMAVKTLSEFGFKKVFSLTGGLQEWKKKIDPGMNLGY